MESSDPVYTHGRVCACRSVCECNCTALLTHGLWFCVALLHSRLHSLRSLSLHNNLLTYLPREILNLIHLEELSLRGNPLVVRFVRDLTYDPPTLLELAARTIKIRSISYTPYDLPGNLLRYLGSASNCPNPKCGGKLVWAWPVHSLSSF